MTPKSRLIGGILLVSGTAIGAGMFAIPVASSFAGFFPSALLLIACWFFLFITSWLLLDVNLYCARLGSGYFGGPQNGSGFDDREERNIAAIFPTRDRQKMGRYDGRKNLQNLTAHSIACPGDINLISMAQRTLGPIGKIICWTVYLLLLYSLTAAYIAGSAPLFIQAIEWMTGLVVPPWMGPFPLLFLFGLFVYLGTSSVDRVNRILMIGLILSYFFLVAFLPAHIQPTLLQRADLHAIWVAVPVVITSFGFHIIIPTLTTYLGHNVKKLRQTIFFGSLIPLFVYIVWELLILGVVPLQGNNGLIQAWVKGEPGIDPLSQIVQNRWIGAAASTFSFFAIITSFLGVSLSLSDFLSDGLKIKRFNLGKELVCLLTFAPPLLFVYLYPRGFLLALQYAGVFVAILLCIFPALMAWNLPRYRSLLRRSLLLIIILISLFVIGLDILEEIGFLKGVIHSYVQT